MKSMLQSVSHIRFRPVNRNLLLATLFPKQNYSINSIVKRSYSASLQNTESPVTQNIFESDSLSHIYKSFYPWKSRQEFFEILLKQVVHNEDGLVVVNKPLGVGVKNQIHKRNPDDYVNNSSLHLRGIGTTNYTLQDAVPFLREALNKPELVLVKSTEKMTSGIAVFAENTKTGEHFQEKLRVSKAMSHQDPLYKYHVITVAAPYTKSISFKERVGLVLKATPLSDLKQPVIDRQFSKNMMKRHEVKPVYVQIEILSRGTLNTALLEIQTSSVASNFLRVYCADLLIPILGDHLYSCRVQNIMGVPAKIDPTHLSPGSSDQKLSIDLLEALELKSEDSITVPPHIHLHSYTLCNYFGKGKPLMLKAPYVDFFKWTCERLNFISHKTK